MLVMADATPQVPLCRAGATPSRGYHAVKEVPRCQGGATLSRLVVRSDYPFVPVAQSYLRVSVLDA